MHTRHIPVGRARLLAAAVALAAVAAVAGCGDVLEVEDPQSFVDERLDDPNAIDPVANGVEGDFMLSLDDVAIFTGMLSDELESTSTWQAWDDISEGNITHDWFSEIPDNFTPAQNLLLRARYSAVDAEERFRRVLGDTADRHPAMIKVKATDAWTDVELGMSYCESPAGPTKPGEESGPAVSDTVIFQQALTKLQATLDLVPAASMPDDEKAAWTAYLQAGLARTNLMLGNYAAALAAAEAVPPGFRKQAIFSATSDAQNNVAANQGHPAYNRAAGMRTIWLPQVDTVAGFLRDPFSGELDRRVPITFDVNDANGLRLGVNNRTPFIGNGKAATLEAPIDITDRAEMNLIEAEVYWRQGNFPVAIDRMNRNRAAAGLPSLVDPGTSEGVFDMLLQERFAELFVEGHRMQDLYRFGLVGARLGPGRATKLPLSRTEILNNPALTEGQQTCPGVS
jgi:starch-binding outer membrane protein, SusD/RagB family